MKRQNVRTLALIVCAFTYLLVGAAIFDALESRHEAEEKRQLAAEEAAYRPACNMTDDEFERLRRVLIRSKHYKGAVQWKFAGAFYFALTVFTTIGYGHSTPKTLGGKMFCIAYALGGIPLGLVMFQSIGERFNVLITCIIARFKRCIGCRRRRHGRGVGGGGGAGGGGSEATQSELIAVACSLCLLVLAAGAAAFSYFEGWEFPNAFYYCFITLATIGFGDYVALQEDHALQRRPEYVAFSVLYILFGLTVFAAALNLLVLRLLTMNTEDERKDELQALATARSSVRLDGDIITAATTMSAVAAAESMGDPRDLIDGVEVAAVDATAGEDEFSVTIERALIPSGGGGDSRRRIADWNPPPPPHTEPIVTSLTSLAYGGHIRSDVRDINGVREEKKPRFRCGGGGGGGGGCSSCCCCCCCHILTARPPSEDDDDSEERAHEKDESGIDAWRSSAKVTAIATASATATGTCDEPLERNGGTGPAEHAFSANATRTATANAEALRHATAERQETTPNGGVSYSKFFDCRWPAAVGRASKRLSI